MRKLTAATAATTILAAMLFVVTASPALAETAPSGWTGNGSVDDATLVARLRALVTYKRIVTGGGGNTSQSDGSGGSSGRDAKTVPCPAGGGCGTTGHNTQCTSSAGDFAVAPNGMMTPYCELPLTIPATPATPAATPAVTVIPQVDIAGARQLALDIMRSRILRDPEIGMNPRPGDDQLVNLPGGSWLWVRDWGAISLTISAPEIPLSLTVTGLQGDTTWRLTDGPSGTVVRRCIGVGTPYDTTMPPEVQRTSCSYTFRHADAHDTVTATVDWGVTWSLEGLANLSEEVNPPPTTSSTILARVVQSQAVNAAR